MSLKQREIKFKPRINLNHNISITFFQLVFFFKHTAICKNWGGDSSPDAIKNTAIHQTQHCFFVPFNLLFRTQPQAMIFVDHNPV